MACNKLPTNLLLAIQRHSFNCRCSTVEKICKMRKKKLSSNTQQKSSGIVIEASDRKARRKDKRQAKKRAQQQKRINTHAQHDVAADTITKKKQKKNRTNRHDDDDERSSKRVKFSNNLVQERTFPSIKNKHTSSPALLIKSNKSASYDHLDDETAAHMRRDDQEIEYLESSLGIKRGSKARELNKEYSKNEGFGDDFGDFLMGLDDVVERCMGGVDNDVEGKFSDGSAEDDEDDAQPGYEQHSEEDDESEDDEMYANDDDLYAFL